MRELVIATHNPHKTAEFRELLQGQFIVSDLSAWNISAPDETGSTFRENALLKALAASRVLPTNLWVLADDSGLEVEALGGAPGIHSARYAGVHGNDQANRTKLLRELNKAGRERRSARFVCALALVAAGNLKAEFEGTVEGRIALVETGRRGFGYDSLFIPAPHEQTFAALSSALKQTLSHRARAVTALLHSLANEHLSV